MAIESEIDLKFVTALPDPLPEITKTTIYVVKGGVGTLILTGSLTVSVADWATGTTCSKAVTNLTTNDDIMLCPDDETAALIAEFGVVRPTQDDDELDFTADSTPDDDLVYLYHIYKGVR